MKINIPAFAPKYVIHFRDVPAAASEADVFSHILQELGKASDPLYHAKGLWAKEMHSYALEVSELSIELTGKAMLYAQEEPFSQARLLAPAASAAEAEEKICKYRLLRRLWQQRLSPAHEVSRELLRVRHCQDFAAFAALPLSPLEATQLLGLVLEDEIVVPQCRYSFGHSLIVSQAIYDAGAMFKASFTRNTRPGAISAVVAADTRDFPEQTTLLEAVAKLDRVVAKRLEANQAAGLHKPPARPKAAPPKEQDTKQSKGLWEGIRQWLEG